MNEYFVEGRDKELTNLIKIKTRGKYVFVFFKISELRERAFWKLCNIAKVKL